MPRERLPSGISPVVLVPDRPYRHPLSPRSPHLVQDRITRHASPSRQHSTTDVEIVPKMKQAYKTSFSAVTAPYRIPRQPVDAVSLQPPLVGYGVMSRLSPGLLERNSSSRATMPCRVSNLHTQMAKSEDILDRSPTTPKESSPTVTFARNDARYASTPGNIRGANKNKSNLSGSSPLCAMSGSSPISAISGSSPAHINGAHNSVSSIRSDDDFVDSSLKVTTPVSTSSTLDDTDVSSFMKNSDPDRVLVNGGLSVDLGPCDYSASVAPRELVEVEYTHSAKITYAELVNGKSELPPANHHTRRTLVNMLHLCGRSVSIDSIAIDDEPESCPEKPHHVSEEPKVDSAAELEQASVFKAQSTSSVWNMFKHLSPRAIRSRRRARSLGPDHLRKSSEKSMESSENSLHVVEVDITGDGTADQSPKVLSKSPNSSPKVPRLFRIMRRESRKRSKDNITNGGSEQSVNMLQARTKDRKSSRSTSRLRLWLERQKNSSDSHISDSKSTSNQGEFAGDSIPAIPASSVKILKPMKPAQEKSVYQAFKDRRSPSQPHEAVSLKPLPLRPVEFPDSLLQKTDSITSSSDHSPVDTPPDVADPRHEAVFRVKPPSSLEIRAMGGVPAGREKFFQSMSTDSIGECSLNVSATGSDPSIASRNGKSQASKRTIHSEDITSDTPALNHLSTDRCTDTRTDTPALNHQSSTDDVDNHVKSNLVASRILSLEGKNGDVDHDKLNKVSPKAPSYLKISCSVSGYHKSNSCTKNDLNKKLSHDRNDILQDCLVKESESHEVDSVLQNGHIEGDELVRSNGHDLDPDNHSPDITSAITNGASTRTDVQNGESRTSSNAQNHVECRSDVVEAQPKSTSSSQGFQQVELVAPSDTQTLLEDHSQSTQNGIQENKSPKKNGSHFLNVVNVQEKHLRELVTNLENVLQDTPDIPDDACGMIRATIGKSNLVINKKFVHYREFCNKNLHPDPTDTRCTTDTDLAGLWDIVYLQILDMEASFQQLDKLRRNGWNTSTLENNEIAPSPAKGRVNKVSHAKKGKIPASKDSTRDPQAAKAREEARIKAREDAKKRLMAAKKAGRQRKASQSDDVEIYVPT